jgi:hypothetical protein
LNSVKKSKEKGKPVLQKKKGKNNVKPKNKAKKKGK